VLSVGYFAIVAASAWGDVAVAFAHTLGGMDETELKRFGLVYSPDDMQDTAWLSGPLAMPGSAYVTGRGIPTVSMTNGYIDVFWLEGGRQTLKHRAAVLR
jgi:hypothetical protein